MKTYFPILIGGLLPAILWGMTAVFQKQSAAAVLGPGRYLSIFGLVICASGLIYAHFTKEVEFNARGASFAALAGMSFALGTGLLSFVLWKYSFPISRLMPILSANVLIPVAFGVFFLGEASDVNVNQLLLGTALVILGAIVVTNA